MGFIYKITNIVNDKIYIGKTEETVENRWKQHQREYTKDRCKDRPLYRAMNKYGLESFTVETIEETTEASEREIYWIEFYGTYSNGYNATKGGDGSKYIDQNLVLCVYQRLKTMVATAKELSISVSTVSSVLKKHKILTLSANDAVKLVKSKKVKCIQLDLIFDGQMEAARFLRPQFTPMQHRFVATKISLCCREKRKSAYKYTWVYV